MLIRAVENQIFRKAAPLAIRHLTKPNLGTREPLARKVLDQAAHEFQLAPPLTIHFADPELMAGLWCAIREAYIVNAKGRATREAVAAEISKLNQCPYCVTVHASMFASAGGQSHQLDDPSCLSPDIAAASAWAAATLSPDSDSIRSPRIASSDIPQIFGTAVLYHYINRSVSVFLTDSPVALPGTTTTLGQKMVRASFKILGRRIVSLDPRPGKCATQREAELPAEFAWAEPNPAIACGLAHFAWAAEKAGREAVPTQVRMLLLDHLEGWRGEQPPLSRGWLEDLVAPLDPAYKPAARLALLTARAAYQVEDGLIKDFRKIAPGDKPLLQTVAWAAFAAARRIASWFLGAKQGTEKEIA